MELEVASLQDLVTIELVGICHCKDYSRLTVMCHRLVFTQDRIPAVTQSNCINSKEGEVGFVSSL